MKLFSEYIILEAAKKMTQENKAKRIPYIINILQFLYLKDIIDEIDNEDIKNKYKALYNDCIGQLSKIKNTKTKDENGEFKIPEITSNFNVSDYFNISDLNKNSVIDKFVKNYDNNLKKQITDFSKFIEKLNTHKETNESLNINENWISDVTKKFKNVFNKDKQTSKQDDTDTDKEDKNELTDEQITDYLKSVEEVINNIKNEFSEHDKKSIIDSFEVPLNNHTEEEDKLWMQYAEIKTICDKLVWEDKYKDLRSICPKLRQIESVIHDKAIKLSKNLEDSEEATKARIKYFNNKKSEEKKKEEEYKKQINNMFKLSTSELSDTLKDIPENVLKKPETVESNEDILLNDLKQQLETIKDVKFDDDNNLYNICKNLIDNFETFVKNIENEEEKKQQIEDYNKKFKKYIEEIEKLNNSLQKDKPSEEKTTNNQKEVNKEVKQTEQKVINSKYLKGLTDGIINDDTREKFEELFYGLADDKIKENPDNEQYLGLTIITIAASILKQNKVDKQNIETYLTI